LTVAEDIGVEASSSSTYPDTIFPLFHVTVKLLIIGKALRLLVVRDAVITQYGPTIELIDPPFVKETDGLVPRLYVLVAVIA
jgi:hypothetical protein